MENSNKTCLFRSSGWLNDNRDSIVKKLGTNAVAEVAKAAGVEWGKLSATKKKPYEKVAGFWAGPVVGEDEMKPRRPQKKTLEDTPGTGKIQRWKDFLHEQMGFGVWSFLRSGLDGNQTFNERNFDYI